MEPDIALAERLFAQLVERTKEADGRGVRRDSYGPGEAAAHEIVAAAARDLDLVVTRDAALNLYMSAAGEDPAAPGIIVGSHLDSVAYGGNYDGAAGVIAGLAALAGFRRIGKPPPRPVTVMAIRAEESVWFDAPYIGSSAALGRLEPALLDSVRRSDTGRTLGDHIAEWGGDLAALRARQAYIEPGRVAAYLELHIEQGPALVDRALPVGVVTAIRGCARYASARCIGSYAHSGATPRTARSDAVVAAARFILGMDEAWQEAERGGLDATVTFGIVNTDSAVAAGSKVAGEVAFVMDLRSTSMNTLEELARRARSLADTVARAHGVDFAFGEPTISAAAAMDPDLASSLLRICREENVAAIPLVSGAGHDAAVFAEAGIPSGMIFMRNRGGSHNPDERLDIEDFSAAARVLTRYLATAG
jgi:N-carbamoyl-L-amino-acid hydrolase